MSITFLLGGVRAGKSARAVALANELARDGEVLFVATAQAFDDEMRQRITAHRAERPRHWQTLEEPLDIANVIQRQLQNATNAPVVVIIDCITLWVSNLLLQLEGDTNFERTIGERVTQLVALMNNDTGNSNIHTKSSPHYIIVSNEVGLGIVPPTALGRQYRDALGRANQLIAAAAGDVVLMVAGLEIPLKTSAR